MFKFCALSNRAPGPPKLPWQKASSSRGPANFPADAQAPSPYLNKPIKHLFSEVLVLEESNSLKAPNCDPNGVGTLPSSSGHEYLELRCEKEFQIAGQQIVGQKRRRLVFSSSPNHDSFLVSHRL